MLRNAVTASFAIALLCLTGCTGGTAPATLDGSTLARARHASLPASQPTAVPPTPTPTPAPPASAVTPISASAFNDSVGVNVHLEYQNNTIWDTGYSQWASTLISSPIVHLRFGLCHYGSASTWCTTTYAARWNQLAAAGKKVDVLTDPWMGWTTATSGCNGGAGGCTSGYPENVGLNAAAVEAYEGPNECNNGGGDCTDYGTAAALAWPTGSLSLWESEIASLRSATVTILGPAAAFCDYSQFPNLASDIDDTAIHDYWFPLQPEDGHTDDCLQSSQTFLSWAKPAIATESGYSTGPPYAQYAGESQLAQERYTSRFLFMHLNPRYNIRRTYIYALVDSASDPDGDFGLLNPTTFAPKPAWTRLMQLMSYFADPGTSPQIPLNYTLAGDTTGALWQDLFQKSDKTYILVPWLGTLQWNWQSATDIAPTTETLTLTLPASVTAITVTQFGDNGAQSVTTIAGKNGIFALPVSSLIEAVSFHT